MTSPLFPEPVLAVSEDERKAARKAGLLGAGLQLLAGSGPSREPRGLFSGLLGALQTGRQFYGDALEAPMARAALGQQQALQAAERDRRTSMYGQLGITGREPVQELYGKLQQGLTVALQQGDEKSAQQLTQVLSSLGGAMSAPASRAPIKIESGDKILLVDPQTMQIVREFPAPKDTRSTAAQDDLRTQRSFQREESLADDYRRALDPLRATSTNLGQALAAVPAAKAGDGASQINVLYAFISALDPASTVREGEVALARSATPVYQQAQSMIAKYTSGQSVVVPPGMLDQMASLMRRRAETVERRARALQQTTQRRAQRWGVDPTVFEPLEPLPAAPAPAGGVNPGAGSASRNFFGGGPR